jgi:manganese transport protein
VRIILKIALGVIAAIGGFVDIGDLVFNAQAGATLRYAAVWAVPIGVLGIIVFAEMSGRVAAISRKPNFVLVRERYGERLSVLTLVASLVLTVLTLGAELGGLGFIINYFFDVSTSLFIIVGLIIAAAAATLLPFAGIERVFGYGGLALLIYAAAAVKLDPNWAELGRGFIPDVQSSAVYWYFVVGLMAAAFMPYEIYFYSSGGVEEGWTQRDLRVNRVNAILGFGLGGILAVSILVASAQVLLPVGARPASVGTVALVTQVPYGELGLVLALVGMLFAIGGATIDTGFSAAYNLAQHRGWKWGKRHALRGEPRFTLSLAGFALLGLVIAESGVDPIALTEYAVVFSVPVLPLTYLPILLAGGNRDLMGDHVNGPLARVLGWGYFVLICVLAVAAPILFVATNGGG